MKLSIVESLFRIVRAREKASIFAITFLFCLSVVFAQDFGENKQWVGSVGGGDGASWSDAANWSPQGVPTANDAVTIASGNVFIPETATVNSLEVGSSARLNLGSTGEPNGAVPSTLEQLSLTITQSATILGKVALGGKNGGNVAFSVGGDLDLAQNSVLAIYAGPVEEDSENPAAFAGDGSTLSVGGNLTISTSAWVYPYSQTTNAGTVRISVCGDAVIAAGGGINASGAGYEFRYGPGYTAISKWTDGEGGSYGGGGGSYFSTMPLENTYGFENAPYCSGSPGTGNGSPPSRGYPGGGAIRLHVTGDVTLNGSLIADGHGKNRGGTYSQGGGSGGSIWVTCNQFSAGASATIRACGGDTDYGGAGSGGGGRVSILLGAITEEQFDDLYAGGECEGLVIYATDLSTIENFPYPSLVMVAPGVAGGWHRNGEAGTTVYGRVLQAEQSVVDVLYSPIGVVESASSTPPMGASLAFSEPITFRANSIGYAVGSNSKSRYFCLGHRLENEETEVASGEETTIELQSGGSAMLKLTWLWGNLEHLIQAETQGSGNVSGEGWYRENSNTELIATPDEGWNFAGWMGDVEIEKRYDNPLVFSVEKPHSVKAVFIPERDEESRTITAVKNGEWFSVETWDAGIIPGKRDDVVLSGKTVYTEAILDCEAKSITLQNSASLRLYSTGSGDYLNRMPLDDKEGTLSLRIGEDLVIDGNSTFALGALDSEYCPRLIVGGNLSLSGSGKMAVYSGNVSTNNLLAFAEGGVWVEVGGTLSMASGSWIYPYSHTKEGASPLFEAKTVTIAQNAGFNANNRGYAYAYGPGTVPHLREVHIDGYGASYGGLAGTHGNIPEIKPCYGFMAAPYWAGSSGTGSGISSAAPGTSVLGGGAIHIRTTGDFNLSGKLLAEGKKAGSSRGAGSGGSIWIICRNFHVEPESAILSVEGGSTTYGWAGPSGGGRISIIEGGHPSERVMERLILTGETSSLRVVYGNQEEMEEVPNAGVYNVKGGTSSQAAPAGEGTLIFLRTPSKHTMLFVR